MPEIISCDLCGSNDTETLQEKTLLLRLPKPFQVVQCRICGLIYQNPRMTEGEYQKYYSEQYYAGWEYLKSAEQKIGEYEDKFLKLEQILPSKGMLLDVGCATGHFMKTGKNRGWEVMGTEISEWSANYAKEQFDLEIRQCKLEEAMFKNGQFDVVNLSHVAEHLPSPSKTLKEIFRILKKDGLLLVEVPNEFNDLLFLIMVFCGKRPSYHHPAQSPINSTKNPFNLFDLHTLPFLS